MGEGAHWKEGLQDLVDQVLGLTPVQWGYAVATLAAVVCWVWVMGEPKARRPAIVGAAVVLGVVLGVGLGLARVGGPPPV